MAPRTRRGRQHSSLAVRGDRRRYQHPADRSRMLARRRQRRQRNRGAVRPAGSE